MASSQWWSTRYLTDLWIYVYLLLYLIPSMPEHSIDGFENSSIDKAAVGNIVVDG